MPDSDIIAIIKDLGVGGVGGVLLIILFRFGPKIGSFFSDTMRQKEIIRQRREEALIKIADEERARETRIEDRLISLLADSINRMSEQINRLNAVLMSIDLRISGIERDQEKIVAGIGYRKEKERNA